VTVTVPAAAAVKLNMSTSAGPLWSRTHTEQDRQQRQETLNSLWRSRELDCRSSRCVMSQDSWEAARPTLYTSKRVCVAGQNQTPSSARASAHLTMPYAAPVAVSPSAFAATANGVAVAMVFP
jgi:hypothetical protein